jgi:hypothetical protein
MHWFNRPQGNNGACRTADLLTVHILSLAAWQARLETRKSLSTLILPVRDILAADLNFNFSSSSWQFMHVLTTVEGVKVELELGG